LLCDLNREIGKQKRESYQEHFLKMEEAYLSVL